MTPAARAALIADVAAVCVEAMQRDAEPPRRSHHRKRYVVRCEKCGRTKRSAIFVRVCMCGGLMGVCDDTTKLQR